MNYIFLDLDGVLNRETTFLEFLGEWRLSPFLVKLFSCLCKEFDAKVVLSSSWRRNLNDDLTLKNYCLKIKEYNAERGIEGDTETEYLLKTLKENGIQLVGKTDEDRQRYYGWDRVGQINRYIKKYLDKDDKFIIIDDEDIFGEAGHLTEEEEKLQSHFIRTVFYKGFDYDAYQRARRKLKIMLA